MVEAKNKEVIIGELSKLYRIDSLDLSGIITEISVDDDMCVEGQERHYFKAGFSALQCIENAISTAQRDKHDIKRILDFPSGFGRALRFIKAYFPWAEITASEIQNKALRFCSRNIRGEHSTKS